MTQENPYFEQIKKDISENDVVLYMKGTAKFPQCGFSALAAQVLQRVGVQFKDVNVLADEGLRQAIKDFTDWPTIPQLYIKGAFYGGSDVVHDMYQSGELQTLLEEKKIPVSVAS